MLNCQLRTNIQESCKLVFFYMILFWSKCLIQDREKRDIVSGLKKHEMFVSMKWKLNWNRGQTNSSEKYGGIINNEWSLTCIQLLWCKSWGVNVHHWCHVVYTQFVFNSGSSKCYSSRQEISIWVLEPQWIPKRSLTPDKRQPLFDFILDLLLHIRAICFNVRVWERACGVVWVLWVCITVWREA